MNRKNMLLLAILAVQLVLVLFAFKPEQQTAPEAKDFFPDLGREGIKGLTISDDKKSVELFSEGGAWYVDRTEKYPAETDKVAELLDKLTGLQSDRLVTRTASSHVRLKVADQVFTRKLTLTTKDGEKTIFLGTSPSNKTLHVRLGDEKEVYLASDLSAWEVQASVESWWRGKYLDLKTDVIKGLTLTNEEGSFTLARDAEKKWHLAGREEAVAEEAASELVAKVANLTVLKYMGRQERKEYHLEKPVATVVIKLQDGGEQTLRIGGKNEDENNHVVKSDASPFYASVAAYAVEPIVQAKSESLLAPIVEESAAQQSAEEAATGQREAGDTISR